MQRFQEGEHSMPGGAQNSDSEFTYTREEQLAKHFSPLTLEMIVRNGNRKEAFPITDCQKRAASENEKTKDCLSDPSSLTFC
jgi:hypothetical protein